MFDQFYAGNEINRTAGFPCPDIRVIDPSLRCLLRIEFATLNRPSQVPQMIDDPPPTRTDVGSRSVDIHCREAVKDRR
jgi:hypothetical protein